MPATKINLSSEAFAIHQQVEEKIRDAIQAQGGVIRFSAFVQIALYQPQSGYYQNPLYTFGEKGDFITAPEMGVLFGQSLARCLQPLVEMGQQRILEIGAGSGALAAAVVAQLQRMRSPCGQYQILEPSGALQAQQKQRLSELSADFDWLATLPESFSGTIIANEVLDAIPFERIQRVDQGWQYLGVAYDGRDFYWQPAGEVKPTDLPQDLQNTAAYIEGYTTEIRPLVTGWIHALADCLTSGNILLFDYGYPRSELYHPQRTAGSMRCFSRHQASDEPLKLAGLQDITAHVDFTQVAETAVGAGLNVEGFTTQSGFLLENGILENSLGDPATLAQETRTDTANYQFSQQVQKLTAPGQMGEVVKVIQLSKNAPRSAAGFSLQDHLHRL